MNMDINYLRYFYFVVKENGFTNAAKFLKVQQPVVSRAIKLLENSIGFELIERQKKTIILTSKGKEVYKIASNMFEQFHYLQKSLIESKQNQEVTIVTSDSIAAAIIEIFTNKLKNKFPQLKLTLLSGSAIDYIDAIDSGKIDFGIFFHIPKIPSTISKTKIKDVDFHYVVKSTNDRNLKTLDSFIGTTAQYVETAEELPLFKKYKFFRKEANIVLVSNSSMARKSAVKKGLGVTILPNFLIEEEVSQKKLTKIFEKQKLAIYLIERKSSYRDKFKNEIIKEVKELV